MKLQLKYNNYPDIMEAYNGFRIWAEENNIICTYNTSTIITYNGLYKYVTVQNINPYDLLYIQMKWNVKVIGK